MIGQALLFLADIKFLNIVDQLLLQAVLIIVHTWNLQQTVDDTRPDFLHAALLVWLNRGQQRSDIVNLLRKLLLQGSTFLGTEIHQILQCLLHCFTGSLPLFLLKLLHIRLSQYIGHTEQCIEPVLRQGNTRLLRDGLYLIVIVLHEGRIDRCGIHHGILLHPYAHIHLTANESLSHHLAHLHLLLTIERGDTRIQIQLLGVKRLDLYMNLLFLVSYDSLAIARH